MALEDLLDVTYVLWVESAGAMAEPEKVKAEINRVLAEASAAYAWERGPQAMAVPADNVRQIRDLMSMQGPAAKRRTS